MIHVSQLVFRHPDSDFTLRLSALAVGAGERVALRGPSGSGKTTLLHLIAGILKPDAGCVRVGDCEPARLSEARRRAFRISTLGLVFQDFLLLDYLDVVDNILLPYRINPALRLDRCVRERALRLAEETGLSHRLRHRPGRLSHGEKQRVAVCRALIAGPRALLADEPTGNLDPAAREQILDLLFAQCGRAGAALLMVTHDASLLPRFHRTVHLPEEGA